MLEEQPGQPVGVERARAAEDRLGPRVVPDRDEPGLVTHELPARQGAGGLLDVVLGIVADPEREQLHQLAGEVLVRVALRILLGVEPDQERRVAEHRVQQPAERAAAERAQRLVLPPHQRQVVDLEVAGGEVVVPHQRQPLGQRIRAEEHAVDPPAFQAIGLGRGQRQVGQAVGEGGEVRRARRGTGPCPSSSRSIDGFGAVLQVAPDFVPGGGEAGPAVQVDDPAEVPGRIGVGDISRPGVARLRRIRIGPHRDLLPGPITRPRP